MTIRFTCDKCGSVLKIKDELAGTDGKCPKCKTRFVVPQPGTEAPVGEVPSEVASDPQLATLPAEVAFIAPESPALAQPAVKATTKPTPKANQKPVVDEDFDPVSFLMEGPKKRPMLDADPAPSAPSPMAGGRSGGGGFSLDDDDSPVIDPPVPTRKWGAKKEMSAADAADRSLGGSKNAAKDLLARSMEESRIRAAQMPEEQPRFNFDVMGFIREVGVKGLGTVAGVVFGFLGLYWLMTSMVSTKVKLPALGFVSGTVTIGGKPTAGVKVYFSPLELEINGADAKQRARDSIGITDAEGHFVLYYNADIQGVKQGPCRVWMEPFDPAVVIPPNFGFGSDFKYDVQPGNNEPQNYEL